MTDREKLACLLCDCGNPDTAGFCDLNRQPSDNTCSWLFDADRIIAAGWKSPDDCANCIEVDGTTRRAVQTEVDQAVAEARKAVLRECQHEWVDRPDKRGDWWMSAFCDGHYIQPRIVQVIDYDRPDRGLEVEDGYMHYVPVELFVTEYYPKAKWQFIPVPDKSGIEPWI